jgi:hypothetical protein
MQRRTKRIGGSKSYSRKSRGSPKGIPIPQHRVDQILKFEEESEGIIWPDMSTEEKANNAMRRKTVLENLRFSRGTNDWSKITSIVVAYHNSLNAKK